MDFEKLYLIKRDARVLKEYLFNENDINNWMKLIVIYNIYLFMVHYFIIYMFVDYFQYSQNNFNDDYRKTFIMFFVLCNLQNTYKYFILNVSKIDYNLGYSFYKNTNEYFI
jgi:hypothetical protein